MSEDIVQKVLERMDEVNEEQARLRKEKGFAAPLFVAHATHVSQEDFRTSVPQVFEKYSDGVEIVPAFAKATQNELSAFKEMLSDMNKEEASKLLSNLPPHPARVFAAATKQDNDGNFVFDERGVPVALDVSYAYAFKKCSASINFVDGDIPLLIGFEDRYKPFEKGEKTGHIYIGKGDSFNAEYDSAGKITEYTSRENMLVAYHLTPGVREAMAHNVQFVMFKSDKDYDVWAQKVQNIEKEKGQKFETFISSKDTRIVSLEEEILQGRAVFINATSRGHSPKIRCLSDATAKRNVVEMQLRNNNLGK